MNNMGKGIGIVITGIIFSIAGGVIAGASAKKAYDEYKSLDKFKEGHIVLKDSNKVNVELASGVINIHHSTTSESYLDYKIYEFYKDPYIEEDNTIKLTKKWNYWFIWFDNFNNKSVVDVYLTDKEYDAFFEVSAGTMTIDNDFTFNSLNIEVSAGTLTAGNLTVNNDANVKISAGKINLSSIVAGGNATLRESAGDMDVKYLEAKSTDIKISAGDIYAKVKSDAIKFGISAGDLTMDIVGDQLDYKTTIKKSAGSCNIKDNQSGTKTLDGKISAGKATVHFVD